MKRFAFFLYFVLILFGLTACSNNDFQKPPSDDQLLAEYFSNKTSDVQVHGVGNVKKKLADDTIGKRHQKFILILASGQTLLIAHNIDISTRIDTLSVHDSVEFYGEYVWNSKGGLVHWTHHDPQGTHLDGWLKHKGITYD